MKKSANLLTSLGLVLSSFLGATLVTAHQTEQKMDKLEQIVNAQHRTKAYVERDQYRHPVETLKFFGIKDTMTVVEISPGGGWYTEILAPYLKDNGQYIAAGYDPKSKVKYFRENAKKFSDKLLASADIYAKTQLTIMQPPEKMDFAQPDSVDMVLSFRNTHNWQRSGHSEKVYAAIFKALKPGGIFGLVQHRAGHLHPEDKTGAMGYLKQSQVIELAKKVGFQLDKRSDINANPKDTRDHPSGVWSLPPVYAEKDKNKDKYKAIGESDRMTLKFVKPHAI